MPSKKDITPDSHRLKQGDTAMVRHSNQIREIAQQRIAHLFEMAEAASHERPDLADRYVAMAVRIARRTRTRIPAHMKRCFCRSCGAYLAPGRTARVRINRRRSTHQTVTCLRCGGISRRGLVRRAQPHPASRAGLGHDIGRPQ